MAVLPVLLSRFLSSERNSRAAGLSLWVGAVSRRLSACVPCPASFLSSCWCASQDEDQCPYSAASGLVSFGAVHLTGVLHRKRTSAALLLLLLSAACPFLACSSRGAHQDVARHHLALTTEGTAGSPPLKEVVAAHLCLPSALSLKAHAVHPSKPCRTTSAIAKSEYAVAGQVGSAIQDNGQFGGITSG